MKPLTEHFHSTQGNLVRVAFCALSVGDKADVVGIADEGGSPGAALRDLNTVSPDAAAALVDTFDQPWQDDPWVHGAYAMYRPGQWFRVRPLLESPHGKVLFAGEHLGDWQGFMEGAVSTGEIAAHHLLH